MSIKKIFSIIIFTLLFAFSVFAQTQAEVIVPKTFLRKAPNSTAEIVQTVQKGDKITFEKSQDTNGWFYVSVLNGKVKGWISGNTIHSLQSINQTPPVTDTPTVKPTPPISISPVPTVTPTPPPVEDNEVLKVDTEEVTLNVRVVDGNNRPVSELNQSQFQVLEDDVPQPVTSFSTTEVPTINALVIDNSRSLRSQLTKIIEAGKIIVGTNHLKDESAIIRFVSSDKIEVVQDFTTSKNSLNNALDNLFVEGGQTAIIDAVYQAAKKVEQFEFSAKKEDVKLRSLILVTDGDDRVSSHTEQELVNLLRESHVQIYAIGFINDLSKEPDSSGIVRQVKAKNFLVRLSQETGGKVYFPDSIDKLPQIASDISGELRTQYLISYTPTNENRDGTFRKIKVVIADGANNTKRTAITRTGRTAAQK